MTIILAPMPLKSGRAIRRELGIGHDELVQMVKDGAPIAITHNEKGEIKMYSAEYNTLQAWRVERSRESAA